MLEQVLESHPSQISSNDCLQEVPLDSLQVERSFEDAKEESIIIFNKNLWM